MTISQNQENPTTLSQTKAEWLKYLKHLGQTPEEQIEKNQAAIQLVKSWREEKIEEEELQRRWEAFETFKRIIDENRSPEQKLYL